MVFFVGQKEVVAVSTFGQLFYYTPANVSSPLFLRYGGNNSCNRVVYYNFRSKL